jgi:hypothetical protein
MHLICDDFVRSMLYSSTQEVRSIADIQKVIISSRRGESHEQDIRRATSVDRYG